MKVALKLRAETSVNRIRSVVRAIEAGDEAMVERVLQLSRTHRAFAPLALTAGALGTSSATTNFC